MVPFSTGDSGVSYGSFMKEYLDKLQQDCGELQPDSPLIHNLHRSGRFTCQPMGHNFLSNLGKDMAKSLKLPDWSAYTGHCFRRSAATAAAENGASAMQMQSHFGWVQSSTALKYVNSSTAMAKTMSGLITGTRGESYEIRQSTSLARNQDDGHSKCVNINTGDNCTINFTFT